jgi:predicted chitinase
MRTRNAMNVTELLTNTGRMMTLLRLAWPLSRDADVHSLAVPLGETMARYQINTVVRAKHFLGQIGHECGQGRYREEIASGAAYEWRTDLGNTHLGDGRRYKGRGLIQLTGRANYAAYSRSELCRVLGIDVENMPELVSARTDMCCDVAGWFWARTRLNEIADGPSNEVETCKMITRRINGGYNGIDDRLRLTGRAKTALGRA